MLLFSAVLSAQKFGGMEPNRHTYISAGVLILMSALRRGMKFDKMYSLRYAALTDGGGIWNIGVFNDWRSTLFGLFQLRVCIRSFELNGHSAK